MAPGLAGPPTPAPAIPGAGSGQVPPPTQEQGLVLEETRTPGTPHQGDWAAPGKCPQCCQTRTFSPPPASHSQARAGAPGAPRGTAAHCDGDNACPLAPRARRDHPWCRGQPGRSSATARGSPGQTQARYNEGRESCPRGAPPAALHPQPASRHLPDRTPQGLQDRGAGGSGGLCSRALAGGAGEQGGCPQCPGWPRWEGERGSLRTEVSVSQLQPVKLLSWR